MQKTERSPDVISRQKNLIGMRIPCGEGACSRSLAKRTQQADAVFLMYRMFRTYDCFAAEREQAPSP
jgi:hypothetical protein